MSPKRNEARPQRATRSVPDQSGQDLRSPTPAEQRTARYMGAWYLLTFVFSFPAFFFYDSLLTTPTTSSGVATTFASPFGALLEILLAISGIATAVVIFPIVKRVSETSPSGTSHRAPWSRFSSWWES